MSRRKQRWLVWLAMFFGGATLFQSVGFTTTGTNPSCYRFTSNGVLSATNFCFLFDCQNGFFGGLVDPCADPSQGATFLDCQGAISGDTGNTQTSTGATTNSSLFPSITP